MNAFMPKASLAFLNCCQSCQIVCLLGQEEDESDAARDTDTFSGSIISAQLTDSKNNINKVSISSFIVPGTLFDAVFCLTSLEINSAEV